jgi:hypothetical protein
VAPLVHRLHQWANWKINENNGKLLKELHPEKGDVLMNTEDIIRMAHEASPDFTWYAALDDPSQASVEELEFLQRFAALVEAAARADERRKCATACYAKAYEINAMGDTEMHPAKAAELCAVAISQMP